MNEKEYLKKLYVDISDINMSSLSYEEKCDVINKILIEFEGKVDTNKY
jgi:hypothetical protein